MSLHARLLALVAAIGADIKALQAAPPGGALVALEADLSADVSLAVSNTWYDGPSLSLGAGTWLVNAHLTHVRTANTAATVYVRLTDGATHHASQQMYHPSASGAGAALSLTALVTLAAPATLVLQCATSAGAAASAMRAALIANGSGSNATKITAVRLA